MSHYVGHTFADYNDPYMLLNNIKDIMEQEHSDNDTLPNKLELNGGVVYDNLEKAMKYLKDNDREYRQFGVPFLDENGEKKWVAKFEFHC